METTVHKFIKIKIKKNRLKSRIFAFKICVEWRRTISAISLDRQRLNEAQFRAIFRH